MYRYLLFLLLVLVFNFVPAADFSCSTLINLEKVSSARVSSILNEKIKIDETSESIAYITEKNDAYFVLEFFMKNHYMRVYGQSYLKTIGSHLTAATWSRSEMIDVVCERTQ